MIVGGVFGFPFPLVDVIVGGVFGIPFPLVIGFAYPCHLALATISLTLPRYPSLWSVARFVSGEPLTVPPTTAPMSPNRWLGAGYFASAVSST